MSMPSNDGDSIEPFIDNLWYYDSVMSPKSGPSLHHSSTFSESSLPLSTGGQSSGYVSLPDTYLSDESESSPASRSASRTTRVEDRSEAQERRPKGQSGELSSREGLRRWMKKVGLQYTEPDGMIRVVDKEGSGQLDMAEFVSLNRFISEESSEEDDSESEREDAARLEVFQLVERHNDGLISPEELGAMLGKLGLLQD